MREQYTNTSPLMLPSQPIPNARPMIENFFSRDVAHKCNHRSQMVILQKSENKVRDVL